MGIDWLTVGAELVNFLALVWLLKRFLYRPVVGAMQRREQHIAARLAAAADREHTAEQQEQAYRERRAALDAERDALLAAARKAADQERERLAAAAREDVDRHRTEWLRKLEREQHELGAGLRQELLRGAIDVARRTLAALADAPLEQQVVAAFLRRLAGLPTESLAPFAASAASLRLASAFALDGAQRVRIETALAETLGRAVTVSYALDPALVCGIELATPGHRIAWSVGDFAGDLETRLVHDIDPIAAPDAAMGAATGAAL